MATLHPTHPRVPIGFDEYLEQRGDQFVGAQQCTGCLRDADKCWQEDGPNIYCENCLRYQHGTDQEEEAVTYAAINGIVRGLAEQNVSLQTVRAACDAAIAAAELAARREVADALRRYGAD